MLPIHAVGIDLGTTYSCLAYLNEHGEPITIPNRDGELSTPSVVLFDGSQAIVGTEALRHSILYPDRVVMHAKRFMGNPHHRWQIQGKSYSPIDISTLILKSLLSDAKERLGKVERAVITVPAQFSEVQRQATAEAGHRAGLKHVDIINEPVSAALCFVLGTEGAWFVELATDQRILVVDLGGGTYDLTIVQYRKNQINVIASGGDLNLGGIDWNHVLEKAIAKQFQKEFGVDPTADRESLQALALEVEQAKRSLSVRPRAALTCQAGGMRKTYQIELGQFEKLSRSLVDRMEQLTLQLLKDQNFGWAHIDVVLTTGGASRMPMVRQMLKRLSGRTLNTSLSPDQSIAHGAAYYAGMLIEKSAGLKSHLRPAAASRLQQFRHRSANARALGILVRNMETKDREPHYLLPANSELPASVTQVFGTVVADQRRVHLRVIESGTAADAHYVELGTCLVEPLPPGLPEGSEIEVTIRYDDQARVHVAAKVVRTGQEAHAEIVRPENLVVSAVPEDTRDADFLVKPAAGTGGIGIRPTIKPPTAIPRGPEIEPAALDAAEEPIPLCDRCDSPLDSRGRCPQCDGAETLVAPKRQAPTPATPKPKIRGIPAPPSTAGKSGSQAKPGALLVPPPPDDDEILDLDQSGPARTVKQSSPLPAQPKVKPPPLPAVVKSPPPGKPGAPKPPTKRGGQSDTGEDEFWKLAGR
jgi:molecular chaperone DnaK